MAYELSPYGVTLVMDIDYFPFTDNLRQFLDTDYDFLVSKHAHDLTDSWTVSTMRKLEHDRHGVGHGVRLQVRVQAGQTHF
jgi:hypothetical protein